MAKLYKIETGIPIPETEKTVAGRKYPFLSMQIGDSFLIPKSDLGKDETSPVRFANSRFKPKKFVSQYDVEGNLRIWRKS